MSAFEKLTAKQAQFVREYLVDLNAKQAAIRCGYAANSAEVTASRLLRIDQVAAAVAEAKAERAEKTGVDAAWVLKRLHDEAVADISDIYDDQGGLLPVHEWPLIWRQGLVQGIDVYEERDEEGRVIGHTRKVKISDRIKRVELIGKHVNVQAFKDHIEVTGLDALASRMERAMKRAE